MQLWYREFYWCLVAETQLNQRPNWRKLEQVKWWSLISTNQVSSLLISSLYLLSIYLFMLCPPPLSVISYFSFISRSVFCFRLSNHWRSETVEKALKGIDRVLIVHVFTMTNNTRWSQTVVDAAKKLGTVEAIGKVPLWNAIRVFNFDNWQDKRVYIWCYCSWGDCWSISRYRGRNS